jgi:hypothetical protein
LNRVILNRYRTEKYFLPEESYFILGLMYFLRAPPKSVPVCPPHQGWSRGVEWWLQVVYRLLTGVRYGFTDLRGKPGGRRDAHHRAPTHWVFSLKTWYTYFSDIIEALQVALHAVTLRQISNNIL